MSPARGPVRPARAELEALVRALALPGVRSGRVPGAAGRAEGWARTALATIDRHGLHVLTPHMPAYPPSFRHLADPPRALFAVGRLELLDSPMVAIVGTRSCTAVGRDLAGRIARGIAAAGATVVSGLALGIDGAAHRGAGPDSTVAVLGCGLDVPYPLQHRSLQRDIARHGLVVTEQLPGAPAVAFHFPRRNRLIAALGLGLVVVEAPVKSGALITVRHALELGRPVFAVPGAVGSLASAGTNALIRDGAVLVTSAWEVLEGLSLPLPPAGADADGPPDELYGVGLALWRAIGPGIRHVDELAAEVGLDVCQSLASLLALEIQGHARQLPGMRFVRDRTAVVSNG